MSKSTVDRHEDKKASAGQPVQQMAPSAEDTEPPKAATREALRRPLTPAEAGHKPRDAELREPEKDQPEKDE